MYIYICLYIYNIKKIYRKSNNTVYSKINKEPKQIANGYQMADSIDCLGKVEF